MTLGDRDDRNMRTIMRWWENRAAGTYKQFPVGMAQLLHVARSIERTLCRPWEHSAHMGTFDNRRRVEPDMVFLSSELEREFSSVQPQLRWRPMP